MLYPEIQTWRQFPVDDLDLDLDIDLDLDLDGGGGDDGRAGEGGRLELVAATRLAATSRLGRWRSPMFGPGQGVGGGGGTVASPGALGRAAAVGSPDAKAVCRP